MPERKDAIRMLGQYKKIIKQRGSHSLKMGQFKHDYSGLNHIQPICYKSIQFYKFIKMLNKN